MLNKIPVLSSCNLICTFIWAEASLPNGMVLPGQGPFQPQAFQDSVHSSLPFSSSLDSSWECARKCPAKRPWLSAPGAHTASGPWHLQLHLHSSLERLGRTSTPGASVIQLWDPWHTQQWSGIPLSSKEKCSCPLRQNSDGAENQVEQALTMISLNQPS